MRREWRRPQLPSQRVLAEFALLTVVVMAITLPVGLLLRGERPVSDPPPLMNVEPLARTAAAHDPTRVAAFPLPPVTQSTPTPTPAPEPSEHPALAPETPGNPSTHAPAAAVAPAPVPAAAEEPTLYFDGRPLRRVRTVRMLVTAYSPDERSCGIWADGITASGYSVWTNGMRLVAADTRILPFGSIVTVPGYNGGQPVPVLDRGGAIKGNRLDVLYPTHEIALRWGVQRLDVDVWEYADED
jgi:3D (Asp-Asp-Asp) domain-containing protein